MTAFRFSANTGYLWKDLPFLDRIRQAAKYGFDGVEFHDEAQKADRAALKDVLAETGLPVYGLNVRMEETFGCAAIPGMGDQAKRDVDAAVEVATEVAEEIKEKVLIAGGYAVAAEPSTDDTETEENS